MVRAKGARHQNNFHMIPFYKSSDMVTGVKTVVVGKGGYPWRRQRFGALEMPLSRSEGSYFSDHMRELSSRCISRLVLSTERMLCLGGKHLSTEAPHS